MQMGWPTLSALRGGAGRLNGGGDSRDGVEWIKLIMTTGECRCFTSEAIIQISVINVYIIKVYFVIHYKLYLSKTGIIYSAFRNTAVHFIIRGLYSGFEMNTCQMQVKIYFSG